MKVTRRHINKIVLKTSAAAFCSPFLSIENPAFSEMRALHHNTPFDKQKHNSPRRHGLSVFGNLDLPEDFLHLPYASLDAEKGGSLIYQSASWAFNQTRLTFNSFNGFVLKSDAPPRIELLYDSLMARNLNEPDAVYGLLAKTVHFDQKKQQLHFELRNEAKFHDGTKVSAQDCVFSYEILKEKGHPAITSLLRFVDHVRAINTQEFLITLKPDTPRTIAPLITTFPIFPEKFYQFQEFDAANLRPPMGSGPYRIGAFKQGRFLEYERIEDYWAKDLPLQKGLYNFDIIRLEFFRDEQIAFEAFKKGNMNLREEFSSRIWATEYNFPAVQNGHVQRQEFADERPSGAQGFFLNMRRPHLQDPRIRQALGLCFDFNWSNEQLFFNLYKRTQSVFENSPLKANGLIPEEEQELLKPFQDQLDQIFSAPCPITHHHRMDQGVTVLCYAVPISS